MDRFEMTEKLRERANVSYEEARAALEAKDWDLLEAMVALENKGKVERANTWQQDKSEKAKTKKNAQGATNIFEDIVKMLTNLVEKGGRNRLEAVQDGRVVLKTPLTVLALLLLFFGWISLPLLVLSFLCGWRYRLVGPDFHKAETAQEEAQATQE